MYRDLQFLFIIVVGLGHRTYILSFISKTSPKCLRLVCRVLDPQSALNYFLNHNNVHIIHNNFQMGNDPKANTSTASVVVNEQIEHYKWKVSDKVSSFLICMLCFSTSIDFGFLLQLTCIVVKRCRTFNSHYFQLTKLRGKHEKMNESLKAIRTHSDRLVTGPKVSHSNKAKLVALYETALKQCKLNLCWFWALDITDISVVYWSRCK
jgi:hypothetical protein